MKTKNSITMSDKYKGISFDLKVASKHASILGLKNKKIRRSLGEFYFKKADLHFNEHRAYINAVDLAMKGFYYFPNIRKILNRFTIA